VHIIVEYLMASEYIASYIADNMSNNDSTIIITHNADLSNAKIYDLMVQCVRDQFLHPESRIVLRLPDTLDENDTMEQTSLLLLVYHDIEYEDIKSMRRHVDSISYKSDDLFDQAMYQNMLEEIVGPANAESSFVFVEREVIVQLMTIEKKKSKFRQVRRPHTLRDEWDDEDDHHKQIKRFRKKEVKYTDITEHPKAHIIHKLYKVDMGHIRFDQIRYYFTRYGFQYNPFDRTKQIQIKDIPFDYIKPFKNLASYHDESSYYSKLIAREEILSALQEGFESKKRIDQLNLDESIKDFTALSYVKYRPNTYIITVWGPGVEFVDSLLHRLNSDGHVYYVKNLEVDYDTLEGVMFWLYNEFSFEKRQDFITKKLDYIKASKSENNKLAVIVFDNINNLPIAGQGSRYKTKLRNIILGAVTKSPTYDGTEFRGNDLIHVNDFHYQTVEYAQQYFNKNSLKILGVQDRSLYLRRSAQKANLILQTLRSYIYQNMDYRDIDRLIIFGSMVMYAMGIRRNTDIDAAIIDIPEETSNSDFVKKIERYFVDDRTKFDFADIGIPVSRMWKPIWDKKNTEWFNAVTGGPKSLTELTTDPEYHFYFQGLKITTLQFEITKKLLRGHGHDIIDLIMLDTHVNEKGKTYFSDIIREYYDFLSDDDLQNLPPHSMPIHINTDPAIHGLQGKDWAVPGKTKDPKRMLKQIYSALNRRYDRDQVDKIKNHKAFKYLLPDYKR
jgi:hypothetical protein